MYFCLYFLPLEINELESALGVHFNGLPPFAIELGIENGLCNYRPCFSYI